MVQQQIHSFMRGMNKDIDPRSIPDNQVTDALNAEYLSDETGTLTSLEPMRGSQQLFEIAPINSVINQLQRFEAQFGSTKTYSFYITSYDENGNTVQDFIQFQAANFTQFQNQLSLSTAFNKPTPTNPSGNLVILTWTTKAVLELKINNVSTKVSTYVDYFDSGKQIRPLQGYELQDKLFLISSITETGTDCFGTEFGVLKNVGGVPTYTRLLRTNTLRLNFNKIIDMSVSLVYSSYYSIDYTYEGDKPRTVYIPIALTTDCAVQYINPSVKGNGTINLQSIDEITSTQLVNNVLRIKFSSQDQIGGALEAGGYRYFVRCGINATENVTEWSLGSGLVPTYKSHNNKDNAWLLIQGDVSGTNTSKINNLLVEGINPNVFDFIEVAAVYYTGTTNSDVTATQAYVIGRKNVTTGTANFIHIGNETTTATIDVGELLQVEDVILSAASQEVKKNRKNLANVEVAKTDDTYQAFVDGITVSTNRFDVGDQGRILATQENVLAVDYLKVSNSFSAIPTYDPYNKFVVNGQNLDYVAPSTGVYSVSFSFTASIPIIDASPNDGFIVKLYSPSGESFNQIKGIFQGINSEGVVIINNRYYQTISSSVNITLTAGQSFTFNIDAIFVNSSWQITGSITSTLVSTETFTETQPNGYQLPENCANKAGYMLNEWYPLYAALHLNNGYVTDPIYIGNHQMNYQYTTSGDVYHSYDGKVYNYNFVLNNLNIGSIKSSVKGISIWRGDAPNNVITTGLYCLADGSTTEYVNYGYYASLPTFNNKAYFDTYNASEGIRKFGIFYTPEVSRDKDELNGGAWVVSYGTLSPYFNQQYYGPNKYSQAVEYRSYNMQSLSFQYTSVNDSEFVNFNSIGKTWLTSGGGAKRKANLSIPNFAASQAEGLALSTLNGIVDGAVVNGLKTNDTGAYLCQLWRTFPDTEPSVDPYNYKLIYTGTFIEIDQTTPNTLSNIQVYGGDTYTVKQIQKLCYSSQRYKSEGDGSADSYSTFITYYTQSRINTDLNYNNYESDKATWTLKGFGNVLNYLQEYSSNPVQEQFNNNPAYWAENRINYVSPYDPNIRQVGAYPSRIYYSEQRTEGGLFDYYRKFLPSNFKDLDAKFGAIVAIKDVTDKMLAIQEDAVQVLPYQSNVAINAGTTQTFIGTGGVYEQQPNLVATFGTNLKSAVLVARNNNGNNILYWFDNIRRKFCRYSWDGVKILSDENGMRTYLLDWNLTQTNDISMGFHPTNGNIFMTKAADETLVWNEKLNCFTSRASFVPERYFTWDINVICPDVTKPTNTWGKVYSLFGSTTTWLRWFGITSPINSFDVEVSTNKGGILPKRYRNTAIVVGTEHDTNYNPSVTVTIDGAAATVPSLELRNGTLYGVVGNDSQNRVVISNFAKYRISLSGGGNGQRFMRIFGIINSFRTKFPNPLGFK